MDIQKLVEQTQQEQQFHQAMFAKNQTILDLSAELMLLQQEKKDIRTTPEEG